MPEEILETPQTTPPVEQKSTGWTKIILVAFVGLGLLAGAAYAGYYHGTQQAQRTEGETDSGAVYGCKEDGDCVLVKDGCCGCTAGGRNTVINKGSLDLWNKRLLGECVGIACPMVISDHWTCFAKPTCVSGECQLLKAPVVGDETKDWQLFESEVYSFEFKYPSNYFIRGRPETYEVLTEEFPLVPFVWILEESYREMGQAPGITLNFAHTAKDTEVFIRDKQEKLLKSWQEFKAESSAYQDAPNPKIISITDYQNGALKTKKVKRVGPPNAPNQNFTEFYFKQGNLIYALSADSESEVETLSDILSTFRFLD